MSENENLGAEDEPLMVEAEKAEKVRVKRGKCVQHPAMKCPNPDEPCIFSRMRKNEGSR